MYYQSRFYFHAIAIGGVWSISYSLFVLMTDCPLIALLIFFMGPRIGTHFPRKFPFQTHVGFFSSASHNGHVSGSVDDRVSVVYNRRTFNSIEIDLDQALAILQVQRNISLPESILADISFPFFSFITLRH